MLEGAKRIGAGAARNRGRGTPLSEDLKILDLFLSMERDIEKMKHKSKGEKDFMIRLGRVCCVDLIRRGQRQQ